MDQPVTLVPLACPQCATPVSAGVEERAWVCIQCGMGLVLDESQGLKPLTVHYSSEVKPRRGRQTLLDSPRKPEAAA